MTEDPKTILSSRTTPLGRVVIHEGREAVHFNDATGTPCQISQGQLTTGDQTELGLWIAIDGKVSLLLNAKQVEGLREMLTRWLKSKKLSE